MKKIVSLILAVLMIVGLFAGCNTDKPTPTNPPATQGGNDPKPTDPPATNPPTTEDKTIEFPLAEPLDISVLTIMPSTYSITENIAWKALMERGNFNAEITEIKAAEMKEKGALIMAGGDYPDILFKCNSLKIHEYGMEGILIPLEDLIREYAPNLTALLDENNGWADILAPDGHVYSLPQIVPSRVNGSSNFVWWINGGWLKNLGLEEPTNPEELYNVLKAFKEKDANGNGDPNDEIPLTFSDNQLRRFLLLLAEGSVYVDNYFTVVDGELVFYPTTEHFKENYLEYLAKLYKEGLLDNAGFSQTQDQLKAIVGASDICGMHLNSSPAFVPTEHYLDTIALTPFNPELYPLNTGVTIGGLAITDACEHPEIIVAWADYLYTEEGGRVIRLGVEGDNYTINEDGTWANIPDKYESNTYQCTLMGSGQLPFRQPDLYLNASNANTRHNNNEQYGEDGLFSKGTVLPTLVLTEEENETASVLKTDILDYVDVYCAQVVSGEADLEATWDEFQAKLKQMDVDELIKIYQAAYARATGK